MQVSIPDSLKLFRTSHFVRGKCRVELDASTGIVMDQQERTTTRVYGDNRGVGSTVSVDQALWLKFENGKEQCFDFPNTDIYLSRPGHKITFISATNQLDPKKYNAYIAFYNHTTDKLHYYFYAWWKRILYSNSQLLRRVVYALMALSISIEGLISEKISRNSYCLHNPQYNQYGNADERSMCEFLFRTFKGFSHSDVPAIIFLMFFLTIGFIIIFLLIENLTDRRYRLFEKHLEKIVEDFRNQLKES